VAAEMKDSELRGLQALQVRNRRRRVEYGARNALSPRGSSSSDGKRKDYLELFLTAIHATERTREDRLEAAHGLPVRSYLDAIEKLEWYAQRWKGRNLS
jgi:hypothetical protein